MRSTESGSHLPDPIHAEGRRIAIIAARFNGDVTTEMLEGCRAGLAEFGVIPDDVDVYWVPGAWELPQTARKVASKGRHDAIIALGCVIRGETAHFDYVAGEASYGLGALARTLDVPLLFGVLTTETHEQAWARASRDQDDKGREVALSALHMVTLYETLEE
jgi:6,7-dimethyl-8-ribityllumazine synthase